MKNNYRGKNYHNDYDEYEDDDDYRPNKKKDSHRRGSPRSKKKSWLNQEDDFYTDDYDFRKR